MTLEQAIRILHPDTYPEDLMDIQHYDGLNGKLATLKAFDDALLLACEAMQREAERQAGCSSCKIKGCGSCAHFKDNEWYCELYGCDEEGLSEYKPDGNYCKYCGKPLNDGKVDGNEL